jgi:hypothetical protein
MIIHDLSQGSEDWHIFRGGIPTASAFKKLITSTGAPSKQLHEYARILAGNKYARKPLDSWGGNHYTDRGTELEPEARAYYEFAYNSVEEVGFVTDDLKRWGCSPDGFVGNDGLVEFKCQIAKEHIKTLLYYSKIGSCPPDYVAQVQGQMMICERDWCDLVFYHPELPKLRIRQFPNRDIIAGLDSQLKAVIKERDRIFQVLKEF